jgi:hypothetical protein
MQSPGVLVSWFFQISFKILSQVFINEYLNVFIQAVRDLKGRNLFYWAIKDQEYSTHGLREVCCLFAIIEIIDARK